MSAIIGTTDRSEIATKVIAAIAEMQKRAPESIGLDNKFEELGIDSLSSFDLLCQLEDELGVVIPDDDARQMTTVGDVIDRVGLLLEKAA